jgi:hypothetical protein
VLLNFTDSDLVYELPEELVGKSALTSIGNRSRSLVVLDRGISMGAYEAIAVIVQ